MTDKMQREKSVLQSKCREEFEKWAGKDKDPLAFRIIEGDYMWGGVASQWEAFQAAYNLREQEVQRLREALRLIYEGSDNITSEGIADIAKQALQQDLTTKE